MKLSSPLALARAAAIVALTVWAVAAGSTAERPVAGVALAGLTASGLWLWRRLPPLPLAFALGGMAIMASSVVGFEGPDDPFILILLAASFGFGRAAPLVQQPWAAAATLFFLSLNLLSGEPLDLPAELVFPVVIVAGPWVLGLALQIAHQRAGRASSLAVEVIQGRDDDLRRALLEERLRLARELHDVAAHHISVLSLQAQVMRRRAAAGTVISTSDLESFERSAQLAMTELRRVIGVLRPPGDEPERDPSPTVEGLDALIEQCGNSGQAISLTTGGRPRPLPAGLSASAYRIVQEALSNARRHAAGAMVAAEVGWEPDRLHLHVSNPMTNSAAHWTPGNGVVGMRERVQLYGGTIVAGPDQCGNWVVDVALPLPT